MAQNAMTAASPVDTEHIQEKAVEAKASMRELVYNTSAAVSNFGHIGDGIVVTNHCGIY